MIRIVKRWADEVIHRCIDDDEVPHSSPLHILDPGHQDSCISGDEPAWLEKDAKSKRLQEWDQSSRVTLGGQDLLGFGRLPPTRGTAGQCWIIDDTQPAADAEKFERVTRFQK